MWAPGGKELIYRGRGWFRSVTATAEPELDIVRRDSLFADVHGAVGGNRNYDVFPNGDLVVVKSGTANTQLVGVTNWRPPRRR